MQESRAAWCRLVAGVVLAIALAPAGSLAAWADETPPPIATLSPDARPTLVIVDAPAELMIMHHAHPLPPGKAEELALRLGLFAAGPIIRRYAREGTDPLPRAWRTDEPDRGFAEALSGALDRTQSNWPWRALRIAGSSTEANDVLAGLMSGEDVVLVTFQYVLEDQMRSVQLNAQAHVRFVRDEGTARESRTQFTIEHLSRPLAADWGHPRKYAAEFRSDGPLDQLVASAALDLSRALAVTVARLTTAAPDVRLTGRHFADLLVKPKCPECRPGDAVLHEEPGRVWVTPSRLAGTVLSLPVQTGGQVASEATQE
ncbi:MAG TPA: hypothetical protein VMD49_09150 [Steroidobacteraceae bacterium]|nr:hypothetical protein [Steroidobacteraceae bacterium]